jgi:hypothetical protein
LRDRPTIRLSSCAPRTLENKPSYFGLSEATMKFGYFTLSDNNYADNRRSAKDALKKSGMAGGIATEAKFTGAGTPLFVILERIRGSD